ncbi:hypothetical protein DOTSEDRAFT_72304 [Dothistroma septosporum NZE10]|uniref:Uncharacterized protein n=1 Tax=Dothistroma septosporum (strain NZE10 / CBS 128990) TaxID=675120 RepID=N1PQX8_DOTSN|nr:hypothetical protein DOTSEDRAFT_72304 [Dothistroma septosporum NZE10]
MSSQTSMSSTAGKADLTKAKEEDRRPVAVVIPEATATQVRVYPKQVLGIGHEGSLNLAALERPELSSLSGTWLRTVTESEYEDQVTLNQWVKSQEWTKPSLLSHEVRQSAGWMSRSQCHKANKRAARKVAAVAAADQKTQQNSSRPLLKIPQEIRLIIYDYVMVNNWDERQQAMQDTVASCSLEDTSSNDSDGDNNQDGSDVYCFSKELFRHEAETFKKQANIEQKKKDFRKTSAEPALLRVCRLLRSEGMKSYHQFLKAEKNCLIQRATKMYKCAEEKIKAAPKKEWLAEEAKSMAIALDLISDVEEQEKKLKHFGCGFKEDENEFEGRDTAHDDEANFGSREVDSEEEGDSDVAATNPAPGVRFSAGTPSPYCA